VIRAININPNQITAGFSFTRFNIVEEVDIVVEYFEEYDWTISQSHEAINIPIQLY
jgi:hypothetical protein